VIYVVLGMHKSGTTLVSQILHHSGINMGEEIDPRVGYGQGDKYERESTWRLNEEILECNGKVSIDIPAPQNMVVRDDQEARMRAIIRGLDAQYQDWGFKDPRTSLVYPSWARVLPQHKIIAIYRPPEELFLRYRPKKLIRRYRDLPVAIKLVKRWCEHNSRLIEYLEGTPMEYLVLEYRRLMSEQKEFERLQAFVGQPLVDQRRKDLYRNRPDRQPAMVKLAAWWVEKQTGLNPEKITERLEDLRR
jgi:hypothetical protein